MKMNERDMLRLRKITIENFKNVEKGTIELYGKRKAEGINILGLYGQNGSGKTAFIDCLAILDDLLSGQSIPACCADYITVGKEYAHLSYEFDFRTEKLESRITYEVKIGKKKRDDGKPGHIAVVYDEKLSASYQDSINKLIFGTIIDSSPEDRVFVPETKFRLLSGGDRNIETDLLLAKKMAYRDSQSFIFHKIVIDIMLNGAENRKYDEYSIYCKIIIRLAMFGMNDLYVIDTKNTALITFDIIPMTFRPEGLDNNFHRNLAFSDGIAVLKEDDLKLYTAFIDNVNIVLENIIPGLDIALENYGTETEKDGSQGYRVEIMSVRDGRRIPLKYESEGIKKIISVLHLLILVYNRENITVAIDELDSGIFEYLLGELLRILSHEGRGQLIFTSHNLRPLETIDKNFIAFTTVNPQNRYVRLANVQSNNNLRDFYFRDIVIAEQKETLYDHTSNARISHAFMKAGVSDEL